MTTPARFRAQCRLLRIATLVVFFGLGLMLALGFIGLPWLQTGGLPLGIGTRVMLTTVQVMPALGYLWALWAVQRALADLACERLFHPTVARALRQIGIGVLAYGIIYTLAHDGLVHQRWFRYVPRRGYLKRLVQAHHLHHATVGKEDTQHYERWERGRDREGRERERDRER